MAQDIQECTAHVLLDINSMLLDIACLLLDIEGLLVMLMQFLLRTVLGLSEPGVRVGSDSEFGQTWLQRVGRCANSSFSSRISVTDRGLVARGDSGKGREEGSYECGVGSASRQ